jgi:hypothetical protein
VGIFSRDKSAKVDWKSHFNVGDIDSLLLQYIGREAELFEIVEKLFGLEAMGQVSQNDASGEGGVEGEGEGEGADAPKKRRGPPLPPPPLEPAVEEFEFGDGEAVVVEDVFESDVEDADREASEPALSPRRMTSQADLGLAADDFEVLSGLEPEGYRYANSADGHRMVLQVEAADGSGTMTMVVQSTTTVGEIKAKISAETGAPIDQLELTTDVAAGGDSGDGGDGVDGVDGDGGSGSTVSTVRSEPLVDETVLEELAGDKKKL